MPDPRIHVENATFELLNVAASSASELKIRWPPDGDFVMNVAGFREACDDAVPVLVNDTLVVHVVSPVGLLLLKLVAWEDRHTTQPGKDAADIAYVLRHSPTFLGEDTLYKEHFDMVTASGFDLELAAARALGRKLSNLVLEPTSQHVRKLLERELTNGIESKLVREVSESLAPAGEIRAHALLSQVLAGLSD